MTPAELSLYIKAEALSLGFTVCKIAKAEPVPTETAEALRRWVADKRHGNMLYLERNTDKRINPQELVPGCRSIICVALNYYPSSTNDRQMHIARYALGRDYHKIIKDKLFLLLKSINSVQRVAGRPFCDTAPLLERFWAERAGVGRIGKNHQIIIPGAGSHFFLGELLVDAELDYDTPIEKNICGNCDACIRNCPTGALSDSGFDARRCLSYLTIEHRGELPPNIGKKMGNCFYGCDRCQAACPHNRHAQPTNIQDFTPKKELLAMSNDDWQNLTREKYSALFTDSAVERCGYEQLKRNIAAISNKKQTHE